MFEGFTGYNVPDKSKHRKRSHTNQYQKIVELSEGMFQICGSSYLKRGERKAVYESILRLVDNLRKYGTYLQSQNFPAKQHKPGKHYGQMLMNGKSIKQIFSLKVQLREPVINFCMKLYLIMNLISPNF